MGSLCIKVWGSFCWFCLMYLIYPMKWNNLVSLRPNYFITIGYLIAGTPWIPFGSAIVMRSQSLFKDCAMLAITGKFKYHWVNTYLKVITWKIRFFELFIHPLFWLYGSPFISYSFMVWFPLKRNSPNTTLQRKSVPVTPFTMVYSRLVL